MTPEYLLNAMDALPERILTETDALRNRKHIRWRPLATAACLILAAGLVYSLWQGPAKDSSGTVGSLTEDAGAMMDQVESGSQTFGGWLATVVTVEQEKLTVRLRAGDLATVELSDLTERPEFRPGQQILIYVKAAELPANTPLKPYKIEIKED